MRLSLFDACEVGMKGSAGYARALAGTEREGKVAELWEEPIVIMVVRTILISAMLDYSEKLPTIEPRFLR